MVVFICSAAWHKKIVKNDWFSDQTFCTKTHFSLFYKIGLHDFSTSFLELELLLGLMHGSQFSIAFDYINFKYVTIFLFPWLEFIYCRNRHFIKRNRVVSG